LGQQPSSKVQDNGTQRIAEQYFGCLLESGEVKHFSRTRRIDAADLKNHQSTVRNLLVHLGGGGGERQTTHCISVENSGPLQVFREFVTFYSEVYAEHINISNNQIIAV
jgi:CRISPR/Cas system CSM-associated protein Csm5 (group 7 of RAMP superfamily)